MAKIFFCGDPHSKFEHIIRAVGKHGPEAIVLLGDQAARHPLDVELASILDVTKIFWISGNHDTDTAEQYDNLFESELKGRNIQERGVIAAGGILIAGIGGVFRDTVWDGNTAPIINSPRELMKSLGPGNRWRGGIPLKHRSTIFPSTIRSLAGMRVDVLVTHDAPGMHRFGKTAFTTLAKDLYVKKAFHGHHHHTIDYPGGVWHGVSLYAITELDTETWETREIDPGVVAEKGDPLADALVFSKGFGKEFTIDVA